MSSAFLAHALTMSVFIHYSTLGSLVPHFHSYIHIQTHNEKGQTHALNNTDIHT